MISTRSLRAEGEVMKIYMQRKYGSANRIEFSEGKLQKCEKERKIGRKSRETESSSTVL